MPFPELQAPVLRVSASSSCTYHKCGESSEDTQDPLTAQLPNWNSNTTLLQVGLSVTKNS